jgi:D-alanyl-D-alanine carboxypeptidase
MMFGFGSVNCAMRSLCTAGAIVVLLTLATPPVLAKARYAAMSVDANTGQVLHAEAADEARYPASLTKVMTLYLVFEQMQLGRLKPDTRLRISSEAASVPPSKLDLDPGDTITVSDAIKALVTKSANDIAVAFAEHIAGSEDRFAEMMTRKARALGMTNTTFRNASGLPDEEQTTTARDMVTLALRLYDTFPREAQIFSLRSFHYDGRNIRNHNTMLGKFPGMDGIKTGYTRVSGFNLLASVHRDGRHVVAVVFGGNSAHARNARMRVILGRALQQASTQHTRKRLVIAAIRPAARGAPAARSAPVRVAAASTRTSDSADRLIEPMTRVASVAVRTNEDAREGGGWRSEVRLAAPIVNGGTSVASRVGANNGWRPSTAVPAARPPSTLHAQAAHLAASPPFAPAPAPRERAARGRGRTEIQVGAFAEVSEARDRLATARQASPKLLGDAGVAMPTVVVGGRTLYRARFVGLDAATAASACAHLRRRQIDCLVTRSE